MNQFQPGILQPPPLAARYLSFSLADPTRLRESLLDLAELVDGDSTVLGLGTSLCQQLHANIPPLKSAPAYSIAGIDIPATPGALWLWMRGSDRGELLHCCRHFEDCLLSTFELDQTVEGFRHGDNQDLTGYRDGTENPTGDEAIEVAFDQSNNPGLHHSSCVAVQQWLHDFDRFALLDTTQKDFAIGRRLSDNEELDDAPASAHVRRTAQESFDPEAFLLRRSMPWVEDSQGGMMFVGFGHSFAAFEAQFHRMLGLEDGITDALFQFSRPTTHAYFWCPPILEGKLDLRVLNL